MTFHVGQKVVCVDDTMPPEGNGIGTLNGLKKGSVYTVRRVGVDALYQAPGVWLEEIIRPDWLHYGETAYNIIRFRPVAYPRQSAEHDIALFTPALGTRTPENA